MTTSPKKSKATNDPEFADARRACRTPAEHEQLALVLEAGWTSAELREYARLYFFRNGRDYPTATSYRRAIADVASCRILRHAGYKPSYDHPFAWLKLFRKAGSKPLPPRREGLLQRGRGETLRINSDEYSWPGHTEEFRSMVEQRARDYFRIDLGQPVHVNAWAASQRAYWREQQAEAKAAEKALAAKAPKSRKKPGKKSRKPPRGKLAPQFSRDWEGHTEAFREEVAAWARKDKGLPSDAYIGPAGWKRACNKHYELTE